MIKHRTTALLTGLLVLALAGCTSEEEEAVEYYISPPISNEISGEAREHYSTTVSPWMRSQLM